MRKQTTTTTGQRKESAVESNLGRELVYEEHNSSRAIGETWPTRVPPDYPEVKYPEELPLVFLGNVDSFLGWLKDLQDFCNLHGFFPAFSSKIEVDTKASVRSVCECWRERNFGSGLESRRGPLARNPHRSSSLERYSMIFRTARKCFLLG